MSDDIVEVDGIRYRRDPAVGWHTVDTVGNLLARAPGSLLDEIERLRADRDRWRFMAMEGSVLTEREALELYEDVMGQADEIERLRAAIRRHRDELPQFADLARGDSILWAVLDKGSENNG